MKFEHWKNLLRPGLAALTLALLFCAPAPPAPAEEPEDPCFRAVAAGELDLALGVCSEQLAADQTPRARASTLNNRGICLLAKGRAEEAADDFGQAIALAPDFAPAYANRGFALARLGRLDQAIKDFDKAVALMPANALAYFNRGHAKLLNGAPEPALADFDRCLSLDPRYTPALVQRGRAWAARGRPDRALKDFDRAIAQDPRNLEAFTQRGLAWEKLGEPRRALADFDQALAFNPEIPQALAGRGLIHKKLGDYARASEDYRRALELNPAQSEAVNGLAWLLATCPDQRYQDPTQAVALALKALEIREDAGRMDTLAAAYAAAGRYGEAVAAQEKAITMVWPGAAAKLKGAYELRLNTYKSKRPWREDPVRP